MIVSSLGNHELLTTLGTTGASGATVKLARKESDGSLTAMKVFALDLNVHLRQRLYQEARIQA